MATAFTSPAAQDFYEWLDQAQREDSPWIYEDEPEQQRKPVRGRGGKPTGKFLPTGKEGVALMTKMHGTTTGEDDMRAKTPKGATPRASGLDLPTNNPQNEDLRRQQQASMDATLAPLDARAAELQHKWGIGRLQTLVPAEWAERFKSAAQKLEASILGYDLIAIRERADVMLRGWNKLDALATEASCEPWQHPDVWEVESPKGRVYAIARRKVDEMNAERLNGVRYITLAEVALILDAWDEDGQVTILRAQFPGAEIVKAGRRPDNTGLHPDDNPEAGF